MRTTPATFRPRKLDRRRPFTTPWARVVPVAVLALLVALPLGAQTRDEPAPGDFRVEAGKVDAGTYTGWRLFHTTCYGCHGVGGVGTSLAPNLVERVKTMSPRAFAVKVLTSYRIVQPANRADADDSAATRDALVEDLMRRQRGSGGRIVMPAWDIDPLVTPHVLDLYAYLSARADGKLGPGEPEMLGRDKR